MNEPKTSTVVIEPSDRVIETLRLALAAVGVEELLSRTCAAPELLEKWINGEEWVPLNVLRETCDVNRENPEAPSYSKVLSECTADAAFKIVVDKELQKPVAHAVTETLPPVPHVPAEPIAEPRAKALKPEAVRHMVLVGTTLFIIPILSVVIGFLLRGFPGAVVGAILGFILITGFIFVFFGFLPKKSRKT